jgi:tRNA G18 (ribose-2'-O)-methylase SpoU
MSDRQLDHHEIKNKESNLLLVLLCDSIRTPENVGMIFRVAEAFGIQKIIFTKNSPNTENTKVKKTSRNTFKELNSIWVDHLKDEVLELRKKEFTIIGLEITNQSISIQNIRFDKFEKIALVIGSERNGISQEILNLIDHCIEIPMTGKNSSMNVVNALSIALYEISKQRKNF